MKKIILSAAAYLAVAITASAQFGVLKNSEMTTTKDEQTGVALTILTDTEKNDSFIYQTDPMWTPDGKWLLFRSSTRSDEPAIERTMPDGSKRSYTPTLYYFMEIAIGKIVQVTDSSIGTVFLANIVDKIVNLTLLCIVVIEEIVPVRLQLLGNDTLINRAEIDATFVFHHRSDIVLI